MFQTQKGHWFSLTRYMKIKPQGKWWRFPSSASYAMKGHHRTTTFLQNQKFFCLFVKMLLFVSVWRQYMASDRNGIAIFMVSATQMHWMQGEALILPTRHVQKWRCLFVVLRLCYLCRHSFLHCIQCHSKKNDTSRVINSHWDISCIFVVYPQYSGHNQMVSTLVVLIYKGINEWLQNEVSTEGSMKSWSSVVLIMG